MSSGDVIRWGWWRFTAYTPSGTVALNEHGKSKSCQKLLPFSVRENALRCISFRFLLTKIHWQNRLLLLADHKKKLNGFRSAKIRACPMSILSKVTSASSHILPQLDRIQYQYRPSLFSPSIRCSNIFMLMEYSWTSKMNVEQRIFGVKWFKKLCYSEIFRSVFTPFKCTYIIKCRPMTQWQYDRSLPSSKKREPLANRAEPRHQCHSLILIYRFVKYNKVMCRPTRQTLWYTTDWHIIPDRGSLHRTGNLS